MSTQLPRHSITETPDIAAAIDEGCYAMPDASRAEVARFLIAPGADVVRADREARIAAVERWAGAFTGTFPPDAAQALKGEWPD